MVTAQRNEITEVTSQRRWQVLAVIVKRVVILGVVDLRVVDSNTGEK